MALAIDIQKRRWLPRKILARIPAPLYSIKDVVSEPHNTRALWLDNLAGWLGRSYTRVALPDEFADALAKSKVKQVLEEKLVRESDSLYGIYFSLERDDEEPWTGTLGLMPPPYNLEFTLVTHDDKSPADVRNTLVKHLFEDKVPDPSDSETKVTRAELAKRFGIRIVASGIDARTESGTTLSQLRSLVRYSMVDHLSDSSFAA